MVIRTWRTQEKQSEINDGRDQTIPDQTLSIKQIVARQGLGLVQAARTDNWYTEAQIHSIMTMDKLDRIDLLREINGDIAQIKFDLRKKQEDDIKKAVQKSIDKDRKRFSEQADQDDPQTPETTENDPTNI